MTCEESKKNCEWKTFKRSKKHYSTWQHRYTYMLEATLLLCIQRFRWIIVLKNKLVLKSTKQPYQGFVSADYPHIYSQTQTHLKTTSAI